MRSSLFPGSKQRFKTNGGRPPAPVLPWSSELLLCGSRFRRQFLYVAPQTFGHAPAVIPVARSQVSDHALLYVRVTLLERDNMVALRGAGQRGKPKDQVLSSEDKERTPRR